MIDIEISSGIDTMILVKSHNLTQKFKILISVNPMIALQWIADSGWPALF